MLKPLYKNNTQTIPFVATKNWNLCNTANDWLVLTEHSGGVPIALEYLEYTPITNSINSSCSIALEQQAKDRALFRDGRLSTGIFYPDNEQVNLDGTFKRLVYSQVQNMFYNNLRDPTKIWGLEYIDFENSQIKRFLSDKFKLYDIPTSVFGEKIIENTVVIRNTTQDNDYTIVDDGKGNLFAESNLFSRQQEIGNFSNQFQEGTNPSCDEYFGITSEEPEVIDAPILDMTSQSFNAHLVFTQSVVPDSIEVWRNQGSGYSLLTTIAGTSSSYNDPTNVTSGQLWAYKVRNLKDGSTSSFSNEVAAENEYLFLGGANVTHSTVVVAYATFAMDDITIAESISMPKLRYVNGVFGLDASFVLVTLDLPLLEYIGDDAHFSLTGIPTIALPALRRIDGDLFCDAGSHTAISFPVLNTVSGSMFLDGASNVLSMSFPSLVNVVGNIGTSLCTSLTTIDFSSIIFHNSQSLQFNDCALTAATVNHILARAVASNISASTIFLHDGTNAAPTGQGIIDKAILSGSNTVFTN